MESEQLFRVPTKAIRAVGAAPALRGPFLFSQVGHCFSVLRRHLKTKAVFVAPGSGGEFLPFFFAFDTCSVQRGQIWARFANKIWARFALLCSADFFAVFRTHRSSARSRSLGDREIRQGPAQAEAREDPALFSFQHFFMTRAALKHEDFIKKAFTLKFLDPVCLVSGFFRRRDLVSSWAIKAVARLPNVTNRSSSRIDKSIDEEAVDVLSCHAASSFAHEAVKTASRVLYAV